MDPNPTLLKLVPSQTHVLCDGFWIDDTNLVSLAELRLSKPVTPHLFQFLEVLV